MGCGPYWTCPSTDWDYLDGGAGNDLMYCKQNGCEALGGAGDDILQGGPGTDILSGQGGSDTSCGKENIDILHGGGGDDSAWGGIDFDSITGGWGNDECRSPQGDCESAAGSSPLACFDDPPGDYL